MIAGRLTATRPLEDGLELTVKTDPQKGRSESVTVTVPLGVAKQMRAASLLSGPDHTVLSTEIEVEQREDGSWRWRGPKLAAAGWHTWSDL